MVQWLACYTTTNQNNNMNISIGISGTFLANPIILAVLLTLLKYKVLHVLKIFWINLVSYYFQLKTTTQLIKSILTAESTFSVDFQSTLLFPSKFCTVLGKKLCEGEMFLPVLWHKFQRLVYNSVRDSDADCGSPWLHLVLPPLYQSLILSLTALLLLLIWWYKP